MENENTFMYGDCVRFYWKDEYYENNTDLVCDWEGYLEGLYGGVCGYDDRLAVVTVTTEGQLRGMVLHPYICTLKRIEHPAIYTKKEEKDDTRPYDLAALYEMHDNIMDNFDFAKVARVMELLDWRWSTGDSFDSLVVPDESEIRRSARKLMTEIIESIGTEHEITAAETGGFRVEFNDWNGEPDLRLMFLVDDWNEGFECWDEYQKNIDNRKAKGRFKPIKK